MNYTNTALHTAAEDGHFIVALFLLENGADKEAQNRYGETAAHSAARKGKVLILELLHAHGADLNSQDHEGNTPLLLAAKHDKQKSVRCLTSFASVAIDIQNNDGKTALYFAVEGELNDIVPILIKQCKARGEDLTAMVNRATKKNETALHAAAQMGYCELADLLIKNGAYVSIRNSDGRTPLECAIKQGSPKIVELLLAREGYVKGVTRAVVNFFSAPPTTLVHGAAESGDSEILDCLIKRGYALEKHDENGDTPLHLAAFHGFCSFAKKLIDSGVAIDPVNKEGKTPLHQAVTADNPDVVKLLVQHHAVIIHEDACGNTPLHCAAIHNHVDVAQLLLEHNASKNVQNHMGHTPLALAQESDHAEMARIIAAA